MASLQPISFAPGDTTGLREDLASLAPVMIDPVDTPLYSRAKKEDIRQVRHDWLTDALDVVTTLPAGVVMAAEPTYATVLARARLDNQVQTFLEVWSISLASEIVAKKGGVAGGIMSEVAREIMRRTKVQQKKVEFTLLSNQASAVDNGTNAGLLEGFFNAVQTNALNLNAALVSTITEAQLITLLTAMFNAGSSANISYLADATSKKAITAFAGRPNSQVVIQAADARIINKVDYYQPTVGGDLELIAHRTMQQGTAAAIVDWDNVAIGELEPVTIFESDAGTFRNRRGWIETMLTLIWKNELAHAKVYNNNTI